MRFINKSTSIFTYDNMVTLSFAMFFIADILRAGFNFLLKMFGLNTEIAPILVLFIIYAPLILVIHKVNGVTSILPFVCIMAVSATLFCVSLILHPEYGDWFNHDTYGVVNYIFRPDRAPYQYLLILLCTSNKDVFKNLKTGAYLIFLGVFARYLMIIGVIPAVWGSITDDAYSMSLGYDALVVAIVMFSHFLRERKTHLFFIFLISVFVMIRYGSRMPLVVFVIYLIAIVFRQLSKYAGQKKLKYISLFSIFVLLSVTMLFVFRNVIVSALTSYSASSRTLQMLLGGQFSYGSGREGIYAKTIEVIRTNPFLGVGLYGDRYHLTDTIRYGYPHNMALEVITTFGIIPGIAMILALIYFVGKNLLKNKDDDWIDTVIIFGSISLQLFVSYSYWYVPAFWGLLAMLHPKRTQEKKVTALPRSRSLNVKSL